MAKSKNYEVGYTKPPESGQWKKGQSGNPSGKKKKAGNEAGPKPFLECLAAELSEAVEVTVQGKKKQTTLGHVLVKKFMNDLLGAPLKDKMKAIELLQKLGVFGLQNIFDIEDPECNYFTEEDRRLIAALTSGEEG